MDKIEALLDNADGRLNQDERPFLLRVSKSRKFLRARSSAG
jgi:hypothetical protein